MNSLSAGSICWLRESDLAKQMLSPLAGDRNPREGVECLFSVVSTRAEISAQTAEDSNLCSAATSLTLESKSRCIASLSRGDGSGDWNPLPFHRCRVYGCGVWSPFGARTLLPGATFMSARRRTRYITELGPYGSPLHLSNASSSRRVALAAAIVLDAIAGNSDELAISPARSVRAIGRGSLCGNAIAPRTQTSRRKQKMRGAQITR